MIKKWICIKDNEKDGFKRGMIIQLAELQMEDNTVYKTPVNDDSEELLIIDNVINNYPEKDKITYFFDIDKNYIYFWDDIKEHFILLSEKRKNIINKLL